MAGAVRASRADLEALLRARKLDTARTSAFAFPELLDERVVVPTGVAVLDEQLHGGVPRGQMSEIVGSRSSGRTSLLFAMLAGATARGEMAALIDTLDTFDVASAATCGIDLGRLLWIRGQDGSRFSVHGSQGITHVSGQWSVAGGQGPGAGGQLGLGAEGPRVGPAAGQPHSCSARKALVTAVGPAARAGQPRPASPTRVEIVVDRAIKALNLVLQAGGFGLVALDLAEVPLVAVRRLPFTTWLRLQRVIEGSETACVLVGPAPVARSAGGVTIALQCRDQWSGAGGQEPVASGRWSGVDEARLFLGLEVEAHLSRARWPETAPCRFQFGASYHL